ncbi:ribbon-helix-helix domain-containing protein [uncultured Thiodictyon sp.]|jgi:hypothetical protein|uniref:ribbon-helix-helix domain-containing protein n=1 Tax=uncultured Thiodictyon sp. TaxID=1846217 RepID=UPI0025DB477F|nr:ribbon-helix-helix domain-containing protein [uncultured Thiodictyon sp.]
MRTLLAQRGLKKGDLSKFIEDAVRWRVFDLAPEALQDLIDEATETVRNETRETLARAAKTAR